MVVHHKEVINMWKYYSQHYISGRGLNMEKSSKVRVSVFTPLRQTFKGKLKEKIHSLYPCYLGIPLASISFQVPEEHPGRNWKMTWCHFWNSCLTWARLFQFFTFQPNYFEISFPPLTKPAVPKSFLEHQICRMLIDVTWKKSFWVKQISLLLGFSQVPGVCGVNLWEGDVVWGSVSQAYVPCMNFHFLPPPTSLLFSLSVY